MTSYPGFALPAGEYAAPAIRRPRVARTVGRWSVGIAVAAALLAGLTVIQTKPPALYMCPPECGQPPSGKPVTGLPRFTAPDGSFSVAYPAAGSAYEVRLAQNGVSARFTGGDGGVMQLFSEPARGRTPRDVVRAVVGRAYPDARFSYAIPNAMVGYQPGYGELADFWPQGSTTSYTRTRILAMAAVKNDVALIAFATGQYRPFGPDFGPGPPSGASLQIAMDLGKYVNSFRWNGDPA